MIILGLPDRGQCFPLYCQQWVGLHQVGQNTFTNNVEHHGTAHGLVCLPGEILVASFTTWNDANVQTWMCC